MTMQLCGARSIAELDRGLIRRRSQPPAAEAGPAAGRWRAAPTATQAG
jgi:hypothetical protein